MKLNNSNLLAQFVMTSCFVLVLMPTFVQGEVYKWKEKDGTVRYSDSPPPSSIKTEIIDKKHIKHTNTVPLKPAEDIAAIKAAERGAKIVKSNKEDISESDKAAQERQKKAEQDKQNKEIKEAEAKQKEENCKAAKSNLETYKQGGRIAVMNEKGEKNFLGDKQILENKVKAQNEVNQYCS